MRAAQTGTALGFDPYLTLAGNYDLGFRKTQFYQFQHDPVVGQWDTRIEGWLPPFRTNFSWGPYLRIAGIAASRNPDFENAWLAAPGGGFELYPFSLPAFRDPDDFIGNILGPVRIYGEYDRQDYWGTANAWRPKAQWSGGLDYWLARHVNDVSPFWWTEVWSGLWWQSANDFTTRYDTLIFANSLRAGLRKPNTGYLSALSPYVVVESSLTRNTQYYWENRLDVGGGIRFAPSLQALPEAWRWFNRFVVYAEYVCAAAYYHVQAPSAVPTYDVRAGISFSIGDWYH